MSRHCSDLVAETRSICLHQTMDLNKLWIHFLKEKQVRSLVVEICDCKIFVHLVSINKSSKSEEFYIYFFFFLFFFLFLSGSGWSGYNAGRLLQWPDGI